MKRKVLALTLALLMAITVLSVFPAMAASISTRITTTRSGDKLYVRKGPHKGNTPTIETVKNNQRVTLISIRDEYDPEGWSKIKVDSTGSVGYLKNKYITYFGFSNSDGEVDPNEDKYYDYSNSPDNDGYKGGGSSSGSGGSTGTYGVVVTRNGGSVNIRKSASASSSSLGKVNTGASITILGKSGAWYRVETAYGVVGYIHGDYVQEGIWAYTTAPTGLNLRTGAGTGYGIIKSLPYYTSVQILSRTSSWSYVRAGGSYGYISNNYYKYA